MKNVIIKAIFVLAVSTAFFQTADAKAKPHNHSKHEKFCKYCHKQNKIAPYHHYQQRPPVNVHPRHFHGDPRKDYRHGHGSYNPKGKYNSKDKFRR